MRNLLLGLFFISALLLWLAPPSVAAQTIYVDDDAFVRGNGQSWVTAYKYLQDALDNAGSGDKIWVAKGVYKPDEDILHPSGTGNRAATFQLVNGVAVYGGFAGGETRLDQRDWEDHRTVLSGDLNGDDVQSGPGNAVAADNCTDAEPIYPGMKYKGTTAGATRDGPTDRGEPNNPDIWYVYTAEADGIVCISVGGGDTDWLVAMHSSCPGTKANELVRDQRYGEVRLKVKKGEKYYVRVTSFMKRTSEFVLTVDTTKDNSWHVVTGRGTDRTAVLDGFVIAGGNAEYGGGGMHNINGSPRVANCIFERNYTQWRGAGMYNEDNSNPTLTNCAFVGNVANGPGGGMLNINSSPTLKNCTFRQNSTKERGGGMENWHNSAPVLMNCVFDENKARYNGGGISNGDGSSPKVVNCTFTANSADSGGAIMNSHNSHPQISNCTFTGNMCTGIRGRGGGVYNEESNATIDNCAFSKNISENDGGAIYNFRGKPTIADCVFRHNIAKSFGGAIRNWAHSAPTIVNCKFTGNSAGARGGGMENSYSSTPKVANCIFEGNSASRYGGGGMANDHAGPKVTNCVFRKNSAPSGGGMENDRGDPEVVGCRFTENSADRGAGMLNEYGKLNIVNCIFTGNTAESAGGGMCNHLASPTVINCTFSGNLTRKNGGAIYNSEWGHGGGKPTLVNCTISTNQAHCGGGMDSRGGDPKLINCILWGNQDSSGKGESSQIRKEYGTLALDYCCVQRWTGKLGGTGNIGADPMFVRNPNDGGDGWGVGDNDDFGDLRLLLGSPCIDAGDSNSVPDDSLNLDADDNTVEPMPFDRDRNPRIAGAKVDMGAYEFRRDE